MESNKGSEEENMRKGKSGVPPFGFQDQSDSPTTRRETGKNCPVESIWANPGKPGQTPSNRFSTLTMNTAPQTAKFRNCDAAGLIRDTPSFQAPPPQANQAQSSLIKPNLVIL
jgi:hypothetical protein